MCLTAFGLQATTKEVKDSLGKQWSQLSDKKRLKWIHKALEQRKEYEVRLPLRSSPPALHEPLPSGATAFCGWQSFPDPLLREGPFGAPHLCPYRLTTPTPRRDLRLGQSRAPYCK